MYSFSFQMFSDMLRHFFSLLSLLVISQFCLAMPEPFDLTAVYNNQVNQVNYVANNTSGFKSQNFVLWDENSDSPDTRTFAEHYQGLMTFMNQQNIRKVILYVKDPANYDFFLPSNADHTNPDNFAYWAVQIMQLPNNPEIVILFDRSGFTWPGATVGGYGSDQIPAYFANPVEKLSWVKAINDYLTTNSLPNLTGVCIDPEPPGSWPGLKGAPAYQTIVNTMDQYKWGNSLTWENGMTFGIDAKPSTFSNLKTFPFLTSDDNDQAIMAMIYASISTTSNYFPGTIFPAPSPPYPTINAPSWRSSNNAPLLDAVYIQAYQSDVSYIYSLQSNPAQAAQRYLWAFQDLPYAPKTGTISGSSGSTTITGTGTSFTTNVLADMPLGIKPGVKFGIISNINSDTSLSLYSALSSSISQSSFFGTETVMKWTFPYITPTMASKIYLMFSCNYSVTFPFFGNWALTNFEDFVSNFYTTGQTSAIFYQNPDSPTPIPLSNNFVIYTFNFMIEVAQWFPWPSS